MINIKERVASFGGARGTSCLYLYLFIPLFLNFSSLVILGQEHQQPTPTTYTNNLHQQPTPTTYTNNLHQQPTPTTNTNNQHQLPTTYTNTNNQHQQPTQTTNTNNQHQQPTPTNALHKNCSFCLLCSLASPKESERDNPTIHKR